MNVNFNIKLRVGSFMNTKNHLNIVLIEPQIPQNTGNIARTCSACSASLHIIKPMGFSIDDKKLKRAGLDYWYELDIHYYEDVNEFFSLVNGNFYYFTTKARHIYSDVSYQKDVYLIFGREDAGIDESLLVQKDEFCVRIPMAETARSLNLSNAVAISSYEYLRQHNFSDLQKTGELTKFTWRT